MVVIDPLVTETSNFWQNHGEMNDVDTASIQTEVFRLPSTCFAKRMAPSPTPAAGCSGNWKGAGCAGRKRVTTARSWRGFYHRLREMYRTEGGKGAEPLLRMSWDYKQPDHPESEEVAKEKQRLCAGRISMTPMACSSRRKASC
ncbi:Formate dehydrogenase, nitrate-inducible, major subunit precursor [Leclercia adecarboxylata]|uniref:Formate dehydrogenase, nitrate-inducible, major subunit n=1 Tax=Leclercia adecarboxylata TaxID=83655 RepID=A0A4U9HUN2_9ENTR|nr:Formate dehydrogenase, nitrate-inducible, major subunit precursor [Leclercia adecarboxylata]